MFQHQGVWLPDGEKHFPEWMTNNGELIDGKGTYQIRKFREAMRHVKQFRIAVDVGAHVGFWSMQMVKRFARVESFEPVAAFRDCFIRNVGGALIDVTDLSHNGRSFMSSGEGERLAVNLHACALGGTPGRVSMKIDPADTGGTHIEAPGGDIELRTLDSFEFADVDFIKIDCEGYELEVLKGARETLERCRPCVIVEQKPHKLGPNFGIQGTPAVDFLLAMGAKQRAVLSGDYILSWD